MSRRCVLTGKTNNNANNVSHSKRRTKRLQKANILSKRIFLPSENRWVTLRVSAAALRSMEKVGVEAYIHKIGAKV